MESNGTAVLPGELMCGDAQITDLLHCLINSATTVSKCSAEALKQMYRPDIQGTGSGFVC